MPKTTKKKLPKAAPRKSSTNNLSIVGLILAILIAPVGLIVSIVALNQIKKNEEQGYSLAIAGIVIGSLLTILNIALVVSTINSMRQAHNVLSTNSGHSTSANKLPPEGSMGYNITIGAWDAEKSTDIGRLYSDLETYHYQINAYPSFADFNSASWRKSAQLPNTKDGTALCDPETTSSSATDCQLANSPTKGVYSYQTWESDGVTPCAAQAGQTCSKYTLTAILIKGDHNHRNPGSIHFVYQSSY
jgi:hypothetical protein